MKSKAVFMLLSLMALLTFFVSIRLATASQLDEDVAQGMYFKRSAYVETDPKFGAFKEELNKRERDRIREARKERMKKKWVDVTVAENEDFKDIKEYLPTIKRGVTTKGDLLEIIKSPMLVKDPSRPWLVTEWRMKQYLNSSGYPEPGKAQKVMGGRYYFTELSRPRMGVRLDLLATLNKYTKLVDYSHYYLDTGYIQDYWLVN